MWVRPIVDDGGAGGYPWVIVSFEAPMTQTPDRHPAVSFRSAGRTLAIPARLDPGLFDPGAETLIFLHIPKAAGTTLEFALRAEALPARRRHVRAVIDPDRFRPPVWIRPGWTGAAPELAALAPVEAGVVSGHFPFGAHEWIRRPGRYITLVRDPVAREVSSFNFHYQRGYLDEDADPAILLDPAMLLDNPQTRMLAGDMSGTTPCDEALYARALDHLDRHFLFAAPAEAANKVLEVVLGLLAGAPVGYFHEQVTRIKRLDPVPADLAEALGVRHAFDLRLYQEVQRRWAAWTADHVQGAQRPSDYPFVVLVPEHFAQNGAVTLAPPASLVPAG